MKRRILVPAALAVIVAAGLTSATAFAGEGEDQDGSDAAILAQAKITLVQAITAAEQNTGAKALDASVENVDGTARFAVDVVKDKTVQTVLIDAQTGNVVKVVAAANGESEGNDEQESE